MGIKYKMNLWAIRWDVVDWIDLALSIVYWRALVKTAMNYWGPKYFSKFSSTGTTGGFRRRAQLHRVCLVTVHQLVLLQQWSSASSSTRTRIAIQEHNAGCQYSTANFFEWFYAVFPWFAVQMWVSTHTPLSEKCIHRYVKCPVTAVNAFRIRISLRTYIFIYIFLVLYFINSSLVVIYRNSLLCQHVMIWLGSYFIYTYWNMLSQFIHFRVQNAVVIFSAWSLNWCLSLTVRYRYYQPYNLMQNL
jgi:hypothetical protein